MYVSLHAAFPFIEGFLCDMNITTFSIPAATALKHHRTGRTQFIQEQVKRRKRQLREQKEKDTDSFSSCFLCVYYFSGLLLLGFITLYVLAFYIYGGGQPFPFSMGTEPLLFSEVALELVAEMPLPPGKVAVSHDGRMFVTLHPASGPNVKVAELISESSAVPFPSLSFQSFSRRRPSYLYLFCFQTILMFALVISFLQLVLHLISLVGFGS